MLIADDTINIRMGIFAPQWSRAGQGYTAMLWVPSASVNVTL